MGRVLREEAKREKNESEKKRILKSAYEIVQLCIKNDQNNAWAAYKWAGIILDDLSRLEGWANFFEQAEQVKVCLRQSHTLII